MAAGFVIRDAVVGDREAVLSFWPHPDRFDRRLESAAIGAESLLVAVPAGERGGAVTGVEGEGSGAAPVFGGERAGAAAVFGGERAGAAAVDGGEGFGAVAGSVSVRWSGGCADASRPLLYALEVRPELRGRGIGTGLIRHVAGLMSGRGVAEITLEVEVGNAAAIRLYRRLGFAMIGPHRHIWHFGQASGSVDVLIMHGRADHLA